MDEIDRQTFYILTLRANILDFYFYSFQANEKEAIWISVGVFGFSCGVSIPFIIFTRLQRMFYEPGAYDHIAFCVEDLSQQAQVSFFPIRIFGSLGIDF